MKQRVRPIALLCGVFLVMALGYLLFWPSRSPAVKTDTTVVDRSALTNEQVIQRVVAHIVVPDNEQPTVATVQDASLLRERNPVFYKDAADGDRLLIWSDKAVLYSPERDRIVAVWPQDSATANGKRVAP